MPFALALSGCAAASQPPPRSSGRAQGVEAATTAGPEQAAIPREGEPAKLAAVIAQLERRATEAPGDPRAQTALAEARFVMGESIAVLGWSDRGDAEAHYAASTQAAEAALAVAAGDPIATYWLAASRYASAQRHGFAAIVQTQASARRMLSEVARMAPEVDRGGAHRLLASMAAHPAHPSLRDLGLAREHAQAALQVDDRAVANLIAFVEHYAIPAQDRAAADEKLRQLEHRGGAEDAIATMRAGQLVATIEDRFE